MGVQPEIEVEVEVPDVEVEVEVPVDAGLTIEANVDAPLVEAEKGGSGATVSGGLCNLICAIIFAVFFVSDLCAMIYYLCCYGTMSGMVWVVGTTTYPASTVITWYVIATGCMLFLWGILALCCCSCYKKNKGDQPQTVTYVDAGYEVGGGADVEVEVELEAPVVEVEVELEAPEIEVEVEVEAPEVEVEVEAEVEVEVEVEV